MSHLEELIAEFYEWQGYVVKCNAMVGRRARAGWDMELDVVAYEPRQNHILHIEPSLDAHSWEKREARFEKKFSAGRVHILKDLFPWLPPRNTNSSTSRSDQRSRRTESPGWS